MFLFLKKSKATKTGDSVSSESVSESVTETLYKHSFELAAKNKTLSLLGKLYETSILTLEPKELADTLTKTIQTDLTLELVGVFLYNETKDTFTPLAFSESERLHSVESKFNTYFKNISIENISKNIFFQDVIRQKKIKYSNDSHKIWGSNIPQEMYTPMVEDGRVVSSLVNPLVLGLNTIGVMLISLNRDYDHLAEYEKESIKSLVNVIAVAIDKALLYQKLRVINTELENANEKLKELDQLKSEFLSLATHQIRSPLTAIRGYASMILQGDFGEVSNKVKDAVEIVLQSSISLVNIVGEFLDISRIEQGRMTYNKEKFDLGNLAREVVNELKPNIDKAKLTIDVKIPESGSYTVEADKGKIKQIIGNLIDNAIKYTVKGNIEVSVSDANGRVKVAIKDSGIGVAPEEMGKLFAKFSRTKDAHKTNVSGTGLGLYIAKKMLTAQGGDMGVTSEGLGKGSTFSIDLPRA